MTVLALPVVIVDNLQQETDSAQAVETVTPSTTSTTAAPVTTTAPTTTTAVPVTTAPPTTAAPTTAPPTTARPTITAPPTTVALRRAAPPPTTVPPTTAAPPPPPPSGSVEEIIRSHFGADGDAAVAVARCESGLNPSAVSPSGYRGLFQLSSDHAAAFAAVTGRDFEDAWDEAGPNSQYARYLFGQRGWAPWGGCAPG